MKTWEMLLRRVRSVVREQYGPHTKEIGSMIVALQEADWYANVGRPSPQDGRVIRVPSLEEAWNILEDEMRYTVEGVLVRPLDHLRELRDSHAPEAEWWRAARKLIIEAIDEKDPPVPRGASRDHEALAMDYASLTLDCILEEIVLSDYTHCTYFREQLQWLAAGYFPCGWDGDWPVGRMRVY